MDALLGNLDPPDTGGGLDAGATVPESERRTSAFRVVEPAPPSRDVCASSLLVPLLPTVKLPKQDLRNGLQRFLAGLGLADPPPNQSEMAAAHRMIAQVRTAIGPVRRAPGGPPGAGGSGGQKQRVVYHPYDLRDAFQMALSLPERMAAHRRILEQHLAALLTAHAETMGRVTHASFQYSLEAREHFVGAMRQEGMFHRLARSSERADYAQGAYAGYYHGRWYYLFSLLRGEALPVGSRMFQYYWRATTFLARVSPNGMLEAKPKRANLPRRREFLFFIQRDRHVQRQLQSNSEFARRVAQILQSLES